MPTATWARRPTWSTTRTPPACCVHPYTFRAENQFLPADYRSGSDPAAYGRVLDEMPAFLRTGIDGLFTDQADIGVLARDTYVDQH